MKGIIITGHGNFATGISSAVTLVAGEQEAYYPVDFLIEDTPEMLKDKIFKAIDQLRDCSEIVIFSDLIGGSPFKVSVELRTECNKQIIVLSGTNLGMVIEGVYARESISNSKEYIEDVLDAGKSQIVEFQLPVDRNIPEDVDGI